jgi:hypothetical protein
MAALPGSAVHARPRPGPRSTGRRRLGRTRCAAAIGFYVPVEQWQLVTDDRGHGGRVARLARVTAGEAHPGRHVGHVAEHRGASQGTIAGQPAFRADGERRGNRVVERTARRGVDASAAATEPYLYLLYCVALNGGELLIAAAASGPSRWYKQNSCAGVRRAGPDTDSGARPGDRVSGLSTANSYPLTTRGRHRNIRASESDHYGTGGPGRPRMTCWLVRLL